MNSFVEFFPSAAYRFAVRTLPASKAVTATASPNWIGCFILMELSGAIHTHRQPKTPAGCNGTSFFHPISHLPPTSCLPSPPGRRYSPRMPPRFLSRASLATRVVLFGMLLPGLFDLLPSVVRAAELAIPEGVRFDRDIEYANPDNAHLQLNI